MAKKRTIHCTTCNTVISEIPAVFPLYKATDSEGNEHYAMLQDRAEVVAALAKNGITLNKWQRVAAKEIVRTGTCSKCEDHAESLAHHVIDGGVYYSCEGCGKTGILMKSEYTMQIRAKAGVVFTTLNEAGQYQPLYGVFSSCDQHTFTIDKSSETPQE